ncbi:MULTISPECIES: FecCD family ABC transporter permease [Bacillus]|uniref:FecCD family ABC transporter permease n=1 Tax=Bacillus TaxID=1386 RepID=UPI000ADE3529|nr:iron chelate uptake ABC transporter family permease subunit [Bacillus glycinifermentans]MBU8785975.1 iron chelate uptake ABC transporter family permease subunit [Bacillus glycinifermentans]NUJ15488.1 iron chelate uptake ABC transporter family permease subunit [Bacillus glycinifermentans]
MKKSLHIKHPFMIVILLFLVMLVCVIISIGFGALYIAPGDVIKNLFGISSDYQFIIQKYRLARVILAVLAGAGLGVSGAILQGVIRNPLASPDVIGITKGASLSAMVVILVFPAAPLIVLPLSAFAGAGLVAVLLMVFVRKKNARPSTIALVGIALGAICHAGMQYMMVKFPGDVNAALIWVTGSLWGRSWDEIRLLAPWLVLFLPILFLLAAKLDLMSLGDELVDGLGERSARLRFMLIFVAVGLAGSCVAVVGSIGFVGLIAPHIARRLVGTKSKYLLPASGLAGSIILLAADSLGRGLMPPVEIPAGILTAIIGAPYFLYLLKAESAKK